MTYLSLVEEALIANLLETFDKIRRRLRVIRVTVIFISTRKILPEDFIINKRQKHYDE
jgi:hypothetical protein